MAKHGKKYIAAKAKIDAKSSATFTFSVKADDGQDALRMTPQLLAGLRVRDIARVGRERRGRRGAALRAVRRAAVRLGRP